MSIEFNGINQTSHDALRNKRSDINDTKQPSPKEQQGDVSAPEKSTTVSLSNTAKLMTAAESALKESSEVDVERVNELKAAISNGSYATNAENMAQKMLDLD